MRMRIFTNYTNGDLTEGSKESKRANRRSMIMCPEVDECYFGPVCADQTRTYHDDAGLSYCSRISDDIALEPDAHPQQWQSRVTLQPTRTNYANEFRTAGLLLMSDWHVHSGYIERRNASLRLSVHLIHDRALRIDDRVSSSNPLVLQSLQPPSHPLLPRVLSAASVASRRCGRASLPRIFPADCILHR